MIKIYNKITRVFVLVFAKISRYLTSAYDLFSSNNIAMLPAYIAFFTMWSIVPIIILWDTIEKFIPAYLSIDSINTKSVTDAFNFINMDFSIGEGSYILFVFILYLSSKPFTSIISASNYIYGLTDKSNFIKVKLKSVFLALLLLITLILLLIIPVLGDKIVQIIEDIIGNVRLFDMLENIRWPVTILYLFVVVFLIYFASPSKRMKFRFFLPGTILTTLGWVLITFLYAIYVNRFADYAKIYSSFTSVVILMIWLYLISYILIIGLVINAAYFREKTCEKS